MKKAVFFDVDDTLYDQMKPFEEALLITFPDIQKSGIEDIYFLFRKKSDEFFPEYQNGIISQKKYLFERLSETIKQIEGSQIDLKESMEFQKNYNKALKTIYPYKEIVNLMVTLRENSVLIGIISNGNYEHQMNKISALGILKYIDSKDIFISERLGVAKPDSRIFLKVLAEEGLRPEDILYIGDNFVNDVLGPKKVGIEVVWLNYRMRKILNNSQLQPSLEIRNLKDIARININ